MEKSRGETVVLNTGLKDTDVNANTMMHEDDAEEDDDVNFERFSDYEDGIDKDEDEEIASFSF